VQFRLGRIPVHVQGWFVLTALLLGSSERHPAKLATWVAIVFVSVLVHELGHALMGMAFGLAPQIAIHGMGGTTSWLPTPEHAKPKKLGYGKSILISLAGPFMGFFFAVLIFGVGNLTKLPDHWMAEWTFQRLLVVNIYWGIFNLVPMLPLDGGNVMRNILGAATKGGGEKAARIISILFALAIAARALSTRDWWVLYLGAIFAYSNIQSLRQAGQMKIDNTLVDAIERAHGALEKQAPKEAISALAPAIVPEASADLRRIAVRMLAFALLVEERWSDLLDLATKERDAIGNEELTRLATFARERGNATEAEKLEALAKSALPTPA
jgi:Zn-dependent protease